MPILHIEHRIADLGTWLQDFASQAAVREQAGVTAVQVFQAEDDPQCIVENLFFDTDGAAKNFRAFLREHWSSSSWLAGHPKTTIFHELKSAEANAAAVLRSTAGAERSARAHKEKRRLAAQSARAIERAPWRIEHRSGSSMYELWNDSATPKFYVGITGEGVLYARTAPRIDGHSSTSFQGSDAKDVGAQVDVSWHRREDQLDKIRRWTGKTPA